MGKIKRYASFLFLPLFVVFTYVFMYVPIVVLVVYSFNKSSLPYMWTSFSVDWYRTLFYSSAILDAFKNSMLVAFGAVVLSLLMSVLLVVGLVELRIERLLTMFYGTLIFPEIVLGVSLLSIFVFFSVPLGIVTLIVGHTLFGLAYSVPIIYSRYKEINKYFIEASMDLGATPTQTFFRITLPMLKPALFVSGLLVFIISLDDFLIAFFCSSVSSQTLSLYIFSMLRSGVSPVVNALSTIMLLVTSVVVLVLSSINNRIRIF
jgi:spermidine/putrescine transport system permease protein